MFLLLLFFGSCRHTSRVSEIVRVDDGVIQRVRGVDIDAAVAERVLKSRGDADVAIGVAVHIQNLNLTNSAVENSVCSDVGNGLVTSNDTRIIGRVGRILGNVGHDALLQSVDFITKQGRGVDICNGRVNIRKIQGVVLEDRLEYYLSFVKPGNRTNLLRTIIVVDRTRSFDVCSPFYSCTLLVVLAV